MEIKFINTIDLELLDIPQPASKFIPDWYKSTNSYINGEKRPDGNGMALETIKKCMPVFDAMTAGYIITSVTDIFISQKDGEPYYEWPSLKSIEFHELIQAEKHPQRNGLNLYPKFTNYWGIKTPKGYSCLFVQPFHRESIFTILPGVVDTDTYTNTVNFPFVLNDKNFEGIIPKGTPIAQVIPFKREEWKSELGSEKDRLEAQITSNKLRLVFFDAYKKMFRSKKEYK